MLRSQINPGIKSSGITEFQAVARTEHRRDSRARGRESEEACKRMQSDYNDLSYPLLSHPSCIYDAASRLGPVVARNAPVRESGPNGPS